MHYIHNLILFLSFIPLVMAVSSTADRYDGGIERTRNRSSIPAVIVFGDSTVDPGNNNFINTIFKSNFPPYGVDFDNSQPTGRFSNGKLTTDFIASYLGIKSKIPPYLDPNLSIKELMTGVSFASAGSGYDPLTSTANNVISMSKQLEQFGEYKARLRRSIGITRAMWIIKRGIYIISCGTNDFTQSRPFSISDYDYQLYILKLSNAFIQELLGHGAQKILIAGLPPIGCLPTVIAMNSGLVGHLDPGPRGCVASPSSLAVGYNRMLQGLLTSMRPTRSGLPQILYFDLYSTVFDQVHRPSIYGYEVVDRGCCGTGLFEEGILCTPVTPICKDRSKYMFWDAIHPSQRAYYLSFVAARPLIDAFVRNS